MACVNDKMKFKFYLIVVNLNYHMFPETTILDNAVLDD